MNILMVLGPSAIINKIQVDISYLPLILMFSLTLVVYLLNFFNIKISRIMGTILLVIYGTFIYSNF